MYQPPRLIEEPIRASREHICNWLVSWFDNERYISLFAMYVVVLIMRHAMCYNVECRTWF